MFRRFVIVPVIASVCLILGGAPVLGQSQQQGIRILDEGVAIQQRAQSNEDLKRAVRMYEQALTIFRKIGDTRNEGAALHNLGTAYSGWGQYDKAADYYEQSLEIKRKIRDVKGYGMTLNSLGNVYRDQGQYDKSVPYLEQALAATRKAGDLKTHGMVLNNLGIVYFKVGQYDKAADYYEKSLQVKKKSGDVHGEGMTLMNLGNVYYFRSQYRKAADYYERALAIAKKTGNVKLEGQVLTCMGLVYGDLGQYQKALEHYEKGLALSRKIGDLPTEGEILNSIGAEYNATGQYAKALDRFEKSLEIRRKIGDKQGEAVAVENLGIIYEVWGQYEKAVANYEQALAITQKIGDARGEGKSLRNLGDACGVWGQYVKAAEYYGKSLEITRKIGDAHGEGQILIQLGNVYRGQGEYDKALASFQKGLEIYEKIGVPTGEPKDGIGNLYLDQGDLIKAESFIKQSGDSDSLGRLALLRSDHAAAKEHYEHLRQAAEKNRQAKSLFTAYTGLGMACEGLGDNPAAAEHFRKAIDFTEEVRSSLNRSERAEFYNVIFGGFYRTTPYEGLARVFMKLNKPLHALKESEYTKARVFAEGLSKRAEDPAPQLPKDVLDKDSQLNDQLAALTKNLQKAYEKDNKEAIPVLEPQVKAAKEKLAAHVDMLRKDYPLFAATKYPQPMDLSQTDLKDTEWVLAYHVTDSGIIIYLTKGKTLVKGLFKPTPRKEVDELVRRFREPMELGPDDSVAQQLTKFDFKSGKKLSNLLLADILSDLPKNTPVIIVPDGSLGVVPFEMLVLNDGGKVITDSKRAQTSGAEFFGDRNPISYYQSITALTLARTVGKQQKPGEKLLAMVDPVFSSDDPRLVKLAKQEKDRLLATLPSDLTMSIKVENGITFPRLPLTARLGESLKKADSSRTDLYEGMQAKKAVLLDKDLTPYRSVVFATHGYFGKDLPGIQEPVLVLSLVGEPKGQDGFLRLSEVMGLKINTDIAALTACQTGLGRHISGEGTMGMGRAFQYAGAKSVLMSLWSVSETASVNLVESFFKHLKEGKNKLEALRLARDEIRKAGYDHPFYWAPFILVGETQ